uniref:Uncharacterized protein n=1 Tax=Rhizophora mucronata TaxID=61149 RepID=A0A2P2LIZ8_RHIMU
MYFSIYFIHLLLKNQLLFFSMTAYFNFKLWLNCNGIKGMM